MRGQESSGDAVGRDHETLDDVPCAIGRLDLKLLHRSVGHDGLDLGAVEVECAFLLAAGAQQRGQAVLRAELTFEIRHAAECRRRGPIAFQPGGHSGIRELRVIPHRRAIDLSGHIAIGADTHVHDQRGAILVFVERGPVCRERFRQHREDSRRRVDGRRVRSRVIVQGRSLGHEGVDVGHGDEQPNPLVVFDRHLELIEIFRLVVVDRGPRKAPQVAKTVHRRIPQTPGFLDGLWRRLRLEAVVDHGANGDVLKDGARVGHGEDR